MPALIEMWRDRELASRMGNSRFWPAYAKPSARHLSRLVKFGPFHLNLGESKTAILRLMQSKLEELLSARGLGNRVRNAGKANRFNYFGSEHFDAIELIDRAYLLGEKLDESEKSKVRYLLRRAVHAQT